VRAHTLRPAVQRIGAAAVASSLVLAGACSKGGTTGAAPDRALVAEGAWSRPTPEGAERAVTYLVLRTDRPDEVTGVSVPPEVAASASLHRTMVHDGGASHHGGGGGELSMESVAALPVAPTEPLVFEPGGNHVMLDGLVAPLRRGDRYDLTLELRSGRRVAIQVAVADATPTR